MREERLRESESRLEQTRAAEPGFPLQAAAATISVAAPTFEPPREDPIVAAAPPAPERVPAPVVRAPAPPPAPIDVDSALRESGLVMIETSREKVPPPAPVEEVEMPRARRERRPPPPDLDTPLQQVETRKTDGESPPPH